MTAMRVLQFITPNGFYGAERWVWALANNLDPEAVTCDLAVTQEHPDQDLTVADEYPGKGQVHYLKMNGSLDLKVISRLTTLLREHDIDLIHTHGYKSDIVGWLAARRAGVRCLSTPHGYPTKAGFKMALYIQAGLIVLRRFDGVAPLSSQLMSDMKRFRISSERVRFIENGVDITELDAWRKDLQQVPDRSSPFHFGYIGQLIPRKGLSELLQVFEQVWNDFPQSRLSLIGDGSQRAELEAQAASLPCHDRITFLGFRSDRLEQLNTFDAFLMTSSLEGIPRCLMEAMAIGVPVIAYDIEGVNQLIEHEQTGLSAPLGDVQELAQQARRLVDNPPLCIQLALAARRRVDERFSARRMAEEYVQLYRDLIADSVPATNAQ